MYIHLDEGRVPDAAKTVTGSGFELLPVHGPETATFPHELDLVVRMAMGSGTPPGEGAEQEHRDVHVAVVGSDKVRRAALAWQALPTDTEHSARTPRRK